MMIFYEYCPNISCKMYTCTWENICFLSVLKFFQDFDFVFYLC